MLVLVLVGLLELELELELELVGLVSSNISRRKELAGGVLFRQHPTLVGDCMQLDTKVLDVVRFRCIGGSTSRNQCHAHGLVRELSESNSVVADTASSLGEQFRALDCDAFGAF